MDQLNNTQVYMDNLEQMIKDLSLDEETVKQLIEYNREDGPRGLLRNPRPMKKQRIHEKGDFVVTKSRKLLKDKCNQNSGQHQENTVVPSVLARNY